jgi:hypothetical protein
MENHRERKKQKCSQVFWKPAFAHSVIVTATKPATAISCISMLPSLYFADLVYFELLRPCRLTLSRPNH